MLERSSSTKENKKNNDWTKGSQKEDSVRAAGASSAQQVHVEQDASGLSTKAAKEMELQKKRRMT